MSHLFYHSSDSNPATQRTFSTLKTGIYPACPSFLNTLCSLPKHYSYRLIYHNTLPMLRKRASHRSGHPMTNVSYHVTVAHFFLAPAFSLCFSCQITGISTHVYLSLTSLDRPSHIPTILKMIFCVTEHLATQEQFRNVPVC